MMHQKHVHHNEASDVGVVATSEVMWAVGRPGTVSTMKAFRMSGTEPHECFQEVAVQRVDSPSFLTSTVRPPELRFHNKPVGVIFSCPWLCRGFEGRGAGELGNESAKNIADQAERGITASRDVVPGRPCYPGRCCRIGALHLLPLQPV